MTPEIHTAAFRTLDDIEDTALVQLVYVSSMTLSSRFSTTIFEEVESHARNYNQQSMYVKR